VAIVLIHLLFLHQTGSNNPLGLNKNTDKTPFHPYFTLKDIVGFAVTLIILTILTLKELYILRDPDSFTPAYPLVTPVHIQPEWYFLFAYAILRSIPNKLGGVIALVISIAILIHPTNKQIKVPRNTFLSDQSSTILNNNKYCNPTNMNWSTTSRRPIHLSRADPNNSIFCILRSKPNNNKVMRQNNRLKLKSLAV
jgi:hypothetical protein